GSFGWASRSRTIPKPSWLPKKPMRILKSIAEPKESILFVTWSPNRKKFPPSKNVPGIKKKDIHFTDKNNIELYIAVLVKDDRTVVDTTAYKPRGRNNDYQFE